MVKTIIVVGKKQVIDKNPGSESFYNFLAGYFTGKGHDTTRVRPEEFNESAVGAEYFVGHSAGTTPILQILKELFYLILMRVIGRFGIVLPYPRSHL